MQWEGGKEEPAEWQGGVEVVSGVRWGQRDRVIDCHFKIHWLLEGQIQKHANFGVNLPDLCWRIQFFKRGLMTNFRL
jgi:hypothetical protein